jgi:hypothetical protein
MTAALGAMLTSGITHFSTLDLTTMHDLAVKTATQSGGLDSSILNGMQFLSNAATRAKRHVIVEVRDDFTASAKTEEEATKRTRATLGANSRMAIHIHGDADTTRDFWFRFKGGNEFEDAVEEVDAVSFSHYPENRMRVLSDNRSPLTMNNQQIFNAQ